MVNKKISELGPAATITGTETIPLLQAGTTVAATVQQLLALVVAGAPGNLDTFFETATQLGLDEATVTTLQALVAGKADAASVAATYETQEWDQSQAVSPTGAALKPYGTIITAGASGFDAGYVESPAVFLDPASGRLAMTYTAYSGPGAAGTASIGLAYSDNGFVWTKAGQLFGGSGVTGDPDIAGTTGSNIVIDSFGVYHLFYIGLDQAGYEAGNKTICHATATSLAGSWTRHGAIIHPDGIPGSWREKFVWHPNLVQNRGLWYLFFNATGAIGGADSERAGYATATALAGPWTVHDADCPLIAPIASDDRIVSGDPFVSREGDHWRMDYSRADVNWNPVGDYWATTTDEAFPTGWVTRGQSTVFGQPGQGFKPWIYRLGGVTLHYSTTYGGIVLATSQGPLNADQVLSGRWRFDPDTSAAGNLHSLLVGEDIGLFTGAGRRSVQVGGTGGPSQVVVGQDSSHAILTAWLYDSTAGNASAIIETYGGTNRIDVQNNTGALRLGGAGGALGFYGTMPLARPVLSYSRSGGGETAAGAAIRTALATLGLITDSTTA